MDRWRGLVAVVTGASAGIGASTACQFQDAGLTVVALARRKDKIPVAVAQARQDAAARGRTPLGKAAQPGALHCVQCDVSNERDVLAAFKWIRDNVGTLHILVNNAGRGGETRLTATNTAEWRDIIDTNVLGLSMCTREAIQLMKEKGVDDGHIVHIGSIAGHIYPVIPGAEIYGATKHAVRVLTEGLRKELVAANSKIRVTEVSPGVVKTEFVDKLKSRGGDDWWKKPHLHPEDVANAILYAVSAPPHVQVFSPRQKRNQAQCRAQFAATFTHKRSGSGRSTEKRGQMRQSRRKADREQQEPILKNRTGKPRLRKRVRSTIAAPPPSVSSPTSPERGQRANGTGQEAVVEPHFAMERWRGRVAVVTGASAGIGAAIAYQLQDAGVDVVALARRVEKIPGAVEAARREAAARGREQVGRAPAQGKLHCVRCDVSNEQDIIDAFNWARDSVGGVDILVNNAGVVGQAKLTETDTPEWRRLLDVNVLGLCICTREAVQQMRARGIDDGHIVHISSVAGHQTFTYPGMEMYSATKHAVRVLTEGLRKELVSAKSKIRVTEVSPGLVRTDILDALNIDQDMIWKLPHLFPEDIANAVLYALGTPPHVQVHEMIVKPLGEE